MLGPRSASSGGFDPPIPRVPHRPIRRFRPLDLHVGLLAAPRMLHWNNDRFLAAPRRNRTWSRPVAGARGRDGGTPLHRSPAIPCSRSAAEGWRIYSGPSSTLPKVNLTIWSRPPKLLRALLQIEVPADDESPIEVTAVPEITCCEGIYHASTTHLFFLILIQRLSSPPRRYVLLAMLQQ
jgi:hypothetical protein